MMAIATSGSHTADSMAITMLARPSTRRWPSRCSVGVSARGWPSRRRLRMPSASRRGDTGSPEQELRQDAARGIAEIVSRPRAAGSPEQELRRPSQQIDEAAVLGPRAAGSPEQELRRELVDELVLGGEPRAAGSPEQELRPRHRFEEARVRTVRPRAAGSPEQELRQADDHEVARLGGPPSRRFTRTGIEIERRRSRRGSRLTP